MPVTCVTSQDLLAACIQSPQLIVGVQVDHSEVVFCRDGPGLCHSDDKGMEDESNTSDLTIDCITATEEIQPMGRTAIAAYTMVPRAPPKTLASTCFSNAMYRCQQGGRRTRLKQETKSSESTSQISLSACSRRVSCPKYVRRRSSPSILS